MKHEFQMIGAEPRTGNNAHLFRACGDVKGSVADMDGETVMPRKVTAPLYIENAIFFLQADTLSRARHGLVWGLPAKILRDNPETGVALEVYAVAGEQPKQTSSFNRAIEVVLLQGGLSFGSVELVAGDYLRVPAGQPVPEPQSSQGAKFLIFFDGAGPVANATTSGDVSTEAWEVVRRDDTAWIAGTAMADAGRDDVPLKIKHYKQDPETGARTYLVAVKPGITIPWEMHDVAEEVYVVDGDYTLAECLPGGSVIGNYTIGGYFYRPPGIAHNGPESGSKTGVTMLIRTPGPLIVELVDGCSFDNDAAQS